MVANLISNSVSEVFKCSKSFLIYVKYGRLRTLRTLRALRETRFFLITVLLHAELAKHAESYSRYLARPAIRS